MNRRALALLAILLVTGCSFSRSVQRRSNLMSYLYPEAQSAPQPNPSGATLQLPLRIGIAFVPGTSGYRGEKAVVDATTEKQLLDIVKKSFVSKDWVGDIQVIPSTYLMPGGGFSNLDQVAKMFNVDVMGLVSVDQIQYSDPNILSIAYLSIVGAYVLPGDRNDTRTLIDTAVFHVPTRTFLLRAPGTSHVKAFTTGAGVEQGFREMSQKGFTLAMTDLAANLDRETSAFKEAVRTGERKDVNIVTAKGESVRGGGAVPMRELGFIVLLALAGLAIRVRR